MHLYIVIISCALNQRF